MDFAIVHFEDENSVAVVPSIWVQADKCYWPPYRGRRLDAAVRDVEKPNHQTWSLISAVRVYGMFIMHSCCK